MIGVAAVLSAAGSAGGVQEEGDAQPTTDRSSDSREGEAQWRLIGMVWLRNAVYFVCCSGLFVPVFATWRISLLRCRYCISALFLCKYPRVRIAGL